MCVNVSHTNKQTFHIRYTYDCDNRQYLNTNMELFTYTIMFISLVFRFRLLIGYIEFVPNFGKVVVW